MRLSKLLATATLSLILTQLPATLWAEETPLDPNVTPPTQAPTGEAKYSGPPVINFYLTDEDNLIIKVDGLLLKDVDGFSWGGFDISEMMEGFEQQGMVKMTEKEDGFKMDVNVPVQQLLTGPTLFGVLYANGNTLSATVDSEKLLAERPKLERTWLWLDQSLRYSDGTFRVLLLWQMRNSIFQRCHPLFLRLARFLGLHWFNDRHRLWLL